ncbi:MAG: DUF423 domain-containing protein [Polyangiaceae bacterium]
MSTFSLGAFSAALAVVFGAFGAHALASIGATRLGWWGTASQYHFIAAFGLMLGGALERSRFAWQSPAGLFIAGSVLFSGSLYAMALGAPRWFGAITPLGGLSLIAAFVWLGVRAL